jgi:hypothetical protein
MSDPYEYEITASINCMDSLFELPIILISKRNSTYTKRVCYIIIDVGSLREPFVLQASLSHHLIVFVMNEKSLVFQEGR